MHKKAWPLALAAFLLAACAGAPATTPVSKPRLVDVTGPVTDVARYAVQDTDTAVRVPFTLDRLDHIDVYVREEGQAFAATPIGTLDPLDDGVASGRAFPPVKLTDLKPNMTYYVRLKGYQDDPADDEDGPVLVNTADLTDSTTKFSTNVPDTDDSGDANEKVTLPGGFKIKLANQDFAGVASGGVTATDGKLVHDAGAIGQALFTPHGGTWRASYDGTANPVFNLVVAADGASLTIPGWQDGTAVWTRVADTNSFAPSDASFYMTLLSDHEFTLLADTKWRFTDQAN